MARLAAQAVAHMTVAQKRTLNFDGHGAYLVVSLPVSAFMGFDDDDNCALRSQVSDASAWGGRRERVARLIDETGRSIGGDHDGRTPIHVEQAP